MGGAVSSARPDPVEELRNPADDPRVRGPLALRPDIGYEAEQRRLDQPVIPDDDNDRLFLIHHCLSFSSLTARSILSSCRAQLSQYRTQEIRSSS